jgi:agmatine deiminase
VNEDTVVTAVEQNRKDENYKPLQNNLKLLNGMRLENGKPLNVIELPMPSALRYKNQRLPASYANFYISNAYVIVPVYRDKNDDKALSVLQQCFPDRRVVGLDSYDMIWGLGSFHCLSQQEPSV